MNKKQLVDQAARSAQKVAQRSGLSIGQTVTTLYEELTRRLDKVEGNTAFVSIPAENSPSGAELKKTLLLSDLFDPNVAQCLAFKLRADMN